MSLSWNYVASMSVGRANCGVTVLSEKIYVGGGRKGERNDDGLDLFEAYDPAIDEWLIKPPMPSKRSYCTVYKKNIYHYRIHYRESKICQFFRSVESKFDCFIIIFFR